MYTIQDIRRINLEKLIKDKILDKTFLKKGEFAKAVDINKDYLSQMTMHPSKKGARPISEDKARQIEAKLNLPHLHLDNTNNSCTNSDQTDFHSVAFQSIIIKPIEMHLNPQLPLSPLSNIQYLTKHTLLNLRVLEDGSSCFHHSATDQSMTPNINLGDVVIVDVTDNQINNIVSGDVYLYLVQDELKINRFSKDIRGGIRLSCDNSNKAIFPDQHIEIADLSLIKLIGKVIWKAGKV